jgi:hypothetical protein
MGPTPGQPHHGREESSSRTPPLGRIGRGREEFGWNSDSLPLGLESKGGVRVRTQTPLLLGLGKGQAGLAWAPS